MITVCLYGGLGEYGRRFSLHTETPAEALRALFTQVRGLKQKIRDGVYQMWFSGEDQSEETVADVFRRPAADVPHIVPRVSGAGKNGEIIQTMLDIVLVVVGAYTSWAGGDSLVAAGIGMVAGGVAQMLAKQSKLQASKGIEDSKNAASSNLTNTSAQGRPVSLAYDLCYCDSRVTSQEVQFRRIDPAETAASSGTVAEIGLSEIFTAGVVAEAPNGQKYNTDFSDDSVRARNYTASFSKVQLILNQQIIRMGGKLGTGQVTPYESSNTPSGAQSLRAIDVIAEGVVAGFASSDDAPFKSVYSDDTPAQNPDGSFNLNGVTGYFQRGEQDQSYVPDFAVSERTVPVSAAVKQGTPVVRAVTDSLISRSRVMVAVERNAQIKDNGDTVAAEIILNMELMNSRGL